MEISYYEGIVGAIETLNSNKLMLKIYNEQCTAMVEDFVHLRNSLTIGPNGGSALIFEELFRLTCKAESVLANCTCEEWLVAAILLNDRYVFDIIRDDLERCLIVLFETHNSSTRLMAERGLFLAELDREYLIIQLNEVLAHTIGEVKLRDRLFARFLLDRLINNYREDSIFDGLSDGVWIDRRNGPRLGDQRNSCPASTVKEITWFGVKLAEKSFHEQLRIKCWEEASLMTKLNHPNVVRFVSCVMQGSGQSPGIVMEREETSLEEYLRDRESQDVRERCRVSQRPVDNRAGPLLDLLVTVHIMEQIALGMEYLHSQNVVHLDLKPANVLLTFSPKHRFPEVKIADLGASRRLEVEGEKLDLNPNLGTTLYRPPEFSGTGLICPKAADVYCFAMTCWQILHCQVPRLTTMEPITCLNHVLQCKGPTIYYVKVNQLGPEVVKGRRLDINPAVPSRLESLIQLCWQPDPDRRLRFSEICMDLQSYRANLLGGSVPRPVFPPPEQQRSMVRRLQKATTNFMLRILPSPKFFSPVEDDVFPGDTS